MVTTSALSISQTASPTWQWHRWQGLPYLTCELLAAFPHGFFTRHFWGRSPSELTPILASEATAYRVRQVHGNLVLNANGMTASDDESLLPEADGIFSDRPNQALWVASADCTPALIADVSSGRVAAVHAGWRGTAKRIVPQAVRQFLAAGSVIKDLRVALGPAIAGEVYQVGEEVAAQVGASFVAAAETSASESILSAMWAFRDPPLLSDAEPGKLRLDVRRSNALQLEKMSFSREQIAIAPHCTYQQPDDFFSYRRAREKKVQWSGIVSQCTTFG